MINLDKNEIESLYKKKFKDNSKNIKKEIENLKFNLNIDLIRNKLIEEELCICTNEMYKKCVEEGGHYLHRERDYQLYGEVTLTCVNCGYIK